MKAFTPVLTNKRKRKDLSKHIHVVKPKNLDIYQRPNTLIIKQRVGHQKLTKKKDKYIFNLPSANHHPCHEVFHLIDKQNGKMNIL